MVKLALLVGTPSIVTFLASPYSVLLEGFYFIFALSAAALLVAILPQLDNK